MYQGYERSVLIYECSKNIIGLELLSVELFLAHMRDKDSINKYNVFGRLFIYCIELIGVLFLIIVVLNFIKVGQDILSGYQTQEVTIIDRNAFYKSYDHVQIKENKHEFSLAPGYVDVELNSKYIVHIFLKSNIMIAVKKVD